MNASQITAFQANGGFTPSAVSVVLVGAVFAVLLLWGAWALRTAYVGWSESLGKSKSLSNKTFFFNTLKRL